jgi:hypothetical protein
METRVSATVQLTGKMRKRKIWTFATLWLMEGWPVVDGGRRFFFCSRIGTDGQPMVLAARAESVFPTCLTRRLEGRGNLQNGKPDAGPHHSTGALDRRLECCARGDLRAMAVREVRWEGGWKRGRGPPDGLLVFEFLGLEMRQVGRVGKFRAC